MPTFKLFPKGDEEGEVDELVGAIPARLEVSCIVFWFRCLYDLPTYRNLSGMELRKPRRSPLRKPLAHKQHCTMEKMKLFVSYYPCNDSTSIDNIPLHPDSTIVRHVHT
jgi:hypothetical protein